MDGSSGAAEMKEEDDEALKITRLMFRDFSMDFMKRDFEGSDTLADLDDFIEQWCKKHFRLGESE